MKWEQLELKQVSEYIADGDHQPAPKADSGISFIKIKDIENNTISFSSSVYVPYDYYYSLPKKRKPQKGDVLYTVVGSYGIPVFVQTEKQFCFERNIALIHPNKKVNPLFLYYSLVNPFFYKQADSVANGAAQKLIPLSKLEKLIINVPSLEYQERIVSEVSVFDNLIKCNQSQIKLLEEAAQRLYKEWFIDLKFPGYENTQIVDGVPEGWEEGVVGDIVCYHDKTRKPLSSMQRSNFKGSYRYFGAAGVLDYIKDYLFEGTYLLFGEDGTVITPEGTPILQYVSGKFWVNNHAHVLTGKPPYSTEYLYMMFLRMGVSDIVTGAAQPKISQARLSAKKIIIPKAELVCSYQNVVKPLFDLILNLETQINTAKEARDRLLPKLMSGEIEV